MAQVGRPPKPAEQKRRLGEPGHSNPLPAVRDVASLEPLRSDVPPDLGDAGRSVWESVNSSAKPWLAPSDRLILVMLCELIDRREEYKQTLIDYGPLIERPIDGHLVANPVAALLISTEKQIVEISSALGLTPADRTRMGLAEVKAKNAFEELLAKRKERG